MYVNIKPTYRIRISYVRTQTTSTAEAKQTLQGEPKPGGALSMGEASAVAEAAAAAEAPA